jgi:hypothetical protein
MKIDSPSITGSLTAQNGLTGSLFGTASWATNASTASFVTASNVVGTVLSASYAANGGGGTFNLTSSIIGNGLSSSFNINHGFNTRNLHITVYDSASGDIVYPDLRHTNANTSSIIFANPPLANQYIAYISQ